MAKKLPRSISRLRSSTASVSAKRLVTPSRRMSLSGVSCGMGSVSAIASILWAGSSAPCKCHGVVGLARGIVHHAQRGGDVGHEPANGVQLLACRRAPPGSAPPTPRTTSCAPARRALAHLRARAVRKPGDFDLILPFDEVVAALGRVGERDLGIQVIAVDSIVGTVDRASGFDRSFRPTSVARAHPLGADRRGDAPRRVAAADRRVPDRRRALRPRRPPPRVGRARARHQGDRGARDRGHHARRRDARADDRRPAAQEPRARVPRARAAPAPSSAGRSSRATRATTARLAEASRHGRSAPAQERGELLDRADGRARVVRQRATRRSSRSLREADQLGSGTEADAYLRVGAERYDRRASSTGLIVGSGALAGVGVAAAPASLAHVARLRPERASNRWMRLGVQAEPWPLAGPLSPRRRLQRARPAMPVAGRRDVGGAAVGGQLGELLALRAALAGREVRVDLRAHRLDELDRHLELVAGAAGLDRAGVVEVLGPHARDQVAAAALRRLAQAPSAAGRSANGSLSAVALDRRPGRSSSPASR